MSRSSRSTRAGLISALASVALALAGCRDATGVDVPQSRAQVRAPATGAAATVNASPRMLVYGAYAGGDLLQGYLGATVTRSATLPDDLTPYKVIWHMDVSADFISDADRAKLVAFVQRGGGLYLSGESNCCFGVTSSINSLVHTVVKNSTNIQVGGLGPVDPIVVYMINPNTEIASLPNNLSVGTPWNTFAPGGMLNIPPQNQFILADPLTTVAAAWDGPALVGDYGRLVVMMDVNWFDPSYFTTASFAILTNISRFLSNAPAPNQAPIASAGGPYTGIEGSSVSLSAAGSSDPNGDVLTYAWDLDLDGAYDDATGSVASRVFGDDGAYTVRVRVTDSKGASSTAEATVTLTNAAPVITSLTIEPNAPVPVGTAVSLAATFSDKWANDGHAATVDWHDPSAATAVAGTLSNPGAISATHTYMTPGVYPVTLTVQDDADAEDTWVHQYVVVYDPSAGFVTGSGWMTYGTTACPVLCGGSAGRADFGFVSKYKKGATVPSGDTRFEFHAGTLALASVEYEWLTVAGKRAQFKGRGTINGAGDYGFLLTAVDDATDAFRIKIWDRSANDAIVFDNQMGADDNAPINTLLNKVSGGGSIVIHAK